MGESTRNPPRLGVQVRYLAWRSVLRTIRQPFIIVPSLSFPLFLLAVNSSGLDAATKLPGFPTDSYLTFALAITFMQGALFATNTAGTNIAEDIGDGFFNRLSLTPMRGAAMLAGQLAGVLLLGLVQAVAYILVGVAFGANVAAGVGGVLVIILLSILVVAAFGTIGLFVGLRSGSGEAVQGLFPVMFVLLFLSSMALPRNLIEQDWFRTVATWNPVSYLIEGFRSLIVTGWDGEALALGFGIAAAMFVLALAAAAAALPSRMVRT
jgi:ABC-2 type transport system permease protein